MGFAFFTVRIGHFLFILLLSKFSQTKSRSYLFRNFLEIHGAILLFGFARMLHVPYGSLDRDRPLFRLPFTSFAVGTILLPLTGLIACIFFSLTYHFEDATYTHCHVGGLMMQHDKSVGLSSRNCLKVSCL